MLDPEIWKDRKILFVNRFFYPDHSATSQILSDLAFDLIKSGKSVEIVTSRLSYDDPSAQLPTFEIIEGVHVYRVWSSRFGRGNLAGRAADYLTFYATAGWKLWQRTNANTVIVAKTDPPLISLIAAPVAWFRSAKLVNWLQDLFPEVASALGMIGKRSPIAGVLRYLRNLSVRSAHMNIVLGRLMEAKLVSQGVPLERIKVIPNWADGISIKPVPREENLLRKKWSLDKKFVVGYSGNLGRAHEFNTILEAAVVLSDRKNIVFVFIGGGAQRTALEKEVINRGLSNVQLRPYQPRELLSQSLSAIDLHLISLNPALEGLIVPSKYYGIAAVGRPSIFIGDTNGEIATILQECESGYSVNSTDSIELVNRILAFVNHPLLWEVQGANARSNFQEKYSREIAVAAFEVELFK